MFVSLQGPLIPLVTINEETKFKSKRADVGSYPDRTTTYYSLLIRCFVHIGSYLISFHLTIGQALVDSCQC